jgi:tetraacyldisaccharide 4'-kinase
MHSILAYLLAPLAWLYAGLMRVRNHLYDVGQRRSARFAVCTLAVGNLSVGGTGKTPHVEYLVRLLLPRYRVATLSRGYGRRSRGVLLAQPESTADQLGDEPMQFYRKFGPQVQVAVGEERILAMPELLASDEPPQVVVLDDAFQHRKLARDLDVLLTDFAAPFYRDWVLPAGRLREGRRGARRADVVVVTKCPPGLPEAARAEIAQQVRHYAGADKPVFFTGIRYLPGQPAYGGAAATAPSGPAVLFTGLANPQPLVDHVRQTGQLAQHFAFADHFRYTPAALAPVLARLHAGPPGTYLLTTEKDMVKLHTPELRAELAGLPIFYLPIEVFFLADQAQFDQLVLAKVAGALARER